MADDDRMTGSMIDWYIRHAAASVAICFVLAIVAEKTRMFCRGDDLGLAATRSSVVSALTFLAVKGLAGKALFLGLSTYVYDNFRITTLDATNPLVWLVVFLGWLVVTPSAHRVHHGSNAEYLDKNFGAVLIVWDRLFGTYEEEIARVRFGIASKRIDSPREVLTGGYPALRADLRRCRSLRAKALVLAAAP